MSTDQVNTFKVVFANQLKKRLNQVSMKYNFTRKSLVLLLIIIAVVYIILITFFSYLRYTNFFTSNWDLGIGMQSLWTNTHGYLLYESGDYESYGVLSFLQVHSTYIAILFSYLYGIYSSPITLFALQAVFISLSIIPLYYISKKVELPPSLTIFVVLIFILNFSIISGVFYDFHWESLIPVEFFSLFLLILEKRFYLASVIFVIGCLTLEIFPFILVGIILYFFLTKSIPGSNTTSLWSNISSKVLLFFLIVAIISYMMTRIAQYDLIPLIVNQPSSLAGISKSTASLFSFNINPANISLSLLYWFIIIVSLGMLPLLSPRLLLIAVPWIFYTFFITINFTIGFGNQDSLLTTPYALLAGIGGLEKLLKNKNKNYTLTIGITAVIVSILLIVPVYGRSISVSLLSVKFPDFYFSVIAFSIIPAAFVCWLKKYHRKPKTMLKYIALFSCSLIAMNLILSPLNTENSEAIPYPGYSFSYSESPEFQYASQIAKLIPKNATVLASDNLFPLVANSRNAYSLSWLPFSDGIIEHLPFNNSNLPDYIFVDQSSFYLPEFLNIASTNISEFGIYAYTYSSNYAGSIGLYKLNYRSTPIYIGVPFPNEQIFNASNLNVGHGGSIVKCQSIASKAAIAGKSNNSTNQTVWYGPYTAISPGNYTLTVTYKIITSQGGLSKENAFGISGWVYHGITLFSRNVTFYPVSNGTWQILKVNFNVKTLILDLQFSGTLYPETKNILSLYLDNMVLTRS